MAMASTKREFEIGKNGKLEQKVSDQEQFLRAFEKPTMIYRYFKTRNKPVFLYRNLSYMKGRMSRSHKSRKEFAVDSMLKQKLSNGDLYETLNGCAWGNFMTLLFLGFYDKSVTDDDVVEVETFMSKVSNKKRKEVTLQNRLGVSAVKINPDDSEIAKQVPVLSISTDSIKPGSANQSIILNLNVTSLPDLSLNEDEEPQIKRAKNHKNLVYEGDLLIYDRNSRCLLTEGEYELLLSEKCPTKNGKTYSPKHTTTTWETFAESYIDELDKEDHKFEQFDLSPKIKFRLLWTKEKYTVPVDRPLPITIKKDDPFPSLDHVQTAVCDSNENYTTSRASNSQPVQIVYQFIYNSNSRQCTEPCNEVECPWCLINCMNLYVLLKHLKLCHARFNFTYVPVENGTTRIDVSLNEKFDGSYAGSPYDFIHPAGSAFSRAGPVQRTPVTRILVCRPRRQKGTLAEFLEIDKTNQRSLITGHNRLYYHTSTCLPIEANELDVDSEGENDPAWLQRKTVMMIDEFTDVNEGEKEFMKMWNLHLMKHGYVGDIQIPLACDMFLIQNGEELLQKNLHKNFVLHMCNLFDYGLLSPESLYKTNQKLQRILCSNDDGRKIISDARDNQLHFWRTTGVHKQKLHQMHHQTELIKSVAGVRKSLFCLPIVKCEPIDDQKLCDKKNNGRQVKKDEVKKECNLKLDISDEKLSKAIVPLNFLKIPNIDFLNGRRKTIGPTATGKSLMPNIEVDNKLGRPGTDDGRSVSNLLNKRKFSQITDQPIVVPARRRSIGSVAPQFTATSGQQKSKTNVKSTKSSVIQRTLPKRRNSIEISSAQLSRKRLSILQKNSK